MNLLEPQTVLALQLADVRKELASLRGEMRVLEKQINQMPEDKTVMPQLRLNLLKEKEHEFIKKAKQIAGERIWINKTLREHYKEVELNQGTSVPVVDIKL